MNNWIPKNKTVKLAILTIFFAVILYFTSLFIIINKIRKIEDFYRDTNSELFEREKLAMIRSTAEKYSEQIQALRNFFVQKGDEVEFIKKIEETARSASVEFEIVSIDTKLNQENSFKEDINVKLKVNGSWINSIYFISQLDKMPFGVSIEKVSLNTDASGTWSGLIDFVVFREK